MRKRVGMVLAVAGLLPAALGMSSPTAAEAAPATHAAPDASSYALMESTVALSPSDAWFVGMEAITGSAFLWSVAFHWNGHTWTQDKSATLGDYVNGLTGVSASGPSDVWAVGFASTGSLIEHYNGHAWSGVKSDDSGDLAQLNAVSARTRSDAWAVGYINLSSNATSAFAEHWNGHTWTRVPTPAINSPYTQFNSVVDLGPSSALAVGNYETKVKNTTYFHEFAERWNGRDWARVSVPVGTPATLNSISGTTATGVMAAGNYTSGNHNVPLIERWTGTHFVKVTQAIASGYLNGITVVRGTNAYAVGQGDNGKTIMEHYNGKKWAAVATPSPTDGAYFVGVGVSPTGSFVEAVGNHGGFDAERYLIVQGNGKTWRLVHQ
jgi:hypothetical protein